LAIVRWGVANFPPVSTDAPPVPTAAGVDQKQAAEDDDGRGHGEYGVAAEAICQLMRGDAGLAQRDEPTGDVGSG
jgi:hypothetical protein